MISTLYLKIKLLTKKNQIKNCENPIRKEREINRTTRFTVSSQVCDIQYFPNSLYSHTVIFCFTQCCSLYLLCCISLLFFSSHHYYLSFTWRSFHLPINLYPYTFIFYSFLFVFSFTHFFFFVLYKNIYLLFITVIYSLSSSWF